MDTQNSGKTPNLTAEEKHDVTKNQPPRAAVLHEIIRLQGDMELERSIAALFWSALAAGLTMGLSLMGMGLLNSRLPDGDGFKVKKDLVAGLLLHFVTQIVLSLL